VANFIGVANLLPATLLGRSDALCDVEVSLGSESSPLRLRAAGGDGASPGQRVVLSLRPEDLALHLAPPVGEPNVLEGEVADTVYLGACLDGRVRVGPHEVSVRVDHGEQFAAGQKVYLTFPPDHGLCLTG
jgi:ABC-type Fe3+/spermidine/putrescine transport system ATPase subunit